VLNASTYSFRNNETGEQYDMIMKYEDKVNYLEEITLKSNQLLPKPLALTTGTGDRTRPPEGFKEVLSKIAEANPNSTLASDFGKKDHASVKKRDCNKKHSKLLQEEIKLL
jgi:hypothetical protein